MVPSSVQSSDAECRLVVVLVLVEVVVVVPRSVHCTGWCRPQAARAPVSLRPSQSEDPCLLLQANLGCLGVTKQNTECVSNVTKSAAGTSEEGTVMQKFYWKGPTGEGGHQPHGHHDGGEGGGGLYAYPRYHRVHQPTHTKVTDAARSKAMS